MLMESLNIKYMKLKFKLKINIRIMMCKIIGFKVYVVQYYESSKKKKNQCLRFLWTYVTLIIYIYIFGLPPILF